MTVDDPGAVAPAQEPSEQSPLLARKDPTPENGNMRPQDEERDAEQAQDETPIADEPTTSKLLLIMGSVWFGVFLNALDGTIVATLSAPISGSFDSGKLFSWLASAYLIANAAVQPLSGKLTDIFGRRSGLLWANLFFLSGNLICGLARREWVIIFGRVVAGIGGGCLNTISTFIASDLIPLRKRGLWQGIGNLAFGLGSSLGGVFGGWINDVWSWRWAFLIQTPFIVVSAAIVFFTVKIPVKDTDKAPLRRVDFLGCFTLVMSLVLLLLGLNSGGNIVPWDHPLIYTSLTLSAVFLAFFICIEDKVASEPALPIRLILDRTVAAACLTNWFTTMGHYAYLFYVPVYFQVQGFSASAAGARLIPNSVGSSVGSLGSGFLMKATGRYYALNLLVMLFLVGGMAATTGTLRGNAPEWAPFLVFFFNGLGYGGMLTITLLALISAVDHEHQAVITSASYAFRSTGSTIGIAIASAVFQNALKACLWGKLGTIENADKVIAGLRDDISAIQKLPGEWKKRALQAYIEAFTSVWISILGLCVIGAAISLAMRENKLYSTISRR